MNSIQPHLRLLPAPPPRFPRAFTLIELLAVLAVLALLASTLVPTLARTRPNAHRFQCLNNLNQIESAMVMYAHDYRDFFPPNPDDPGDDTPGHHWVSNLSQGGPGAFNPDALQDPTHSLIMPYLNTDGNVLKCPADPRQGVYSGTQPSLTGKIIPATRSVSMSQAVGTVCDPYWSCSNGHSGPPRHPVNGPWLSGNHANGCNGSLIWSTFGKTTSFRRASPATIFTFCDENQYSINDASLATCADPASPVFIDFPACFHNGGGGFAFADGHAELHKWKGTIIKTSNPAILHAATAADLLDFNWLAQHSSVRDR